MRYTGPIRSRAQADALASRLEKVLTAEARGAAVLLRRNWHAVAARPDLAVRMIALANCESLDVNRPGSVMHGIMGGR